MERAGRRVHARARSGFSLVEVAVALGISGIVAALLGATLVATLNITRRAADEADTLQFARLALTVMAREIRESTAAPETMTLWPEDGAERVQALALMSARREAAGRPFRVGSSGQSTWQTVVYYLHDRSRAELHRIAGPWSGSLTAPATDEGRVVARRVRNVRVRREQQVIRISMEVIIGQHTMRLETAVAPRN